MQIDRRIPMNDSFDIPPEKVPESDPKDEDKGKPINED